MKNLLLVFLIFCSAGLCSVAYAQLGPTCTSLNIPIEQDGNATILVGSFVPNAALAAPLTVTLENPYGGVIRTVTNANAGTFFEFAACQYLGRELKLVVTGTSSCWSYVTLKQGNAPMITGRSATVYCDDPLVQGGHVDGVAPTAMTPCLPDAPASLVGDWVVPFDCVLGNDTAKIIYRQYEAFGKDGTRGYDSDTIVVFRFPRLSAANVQCVEKDTTYCGSVAGTSFGPFVILEKIGSSPPECDTIYLLDSLGNAIALDPKCGLQIGVEKDEFENPCESVTKYTVAIKQSCYGGEASANCPVMPASSLDSLGDGYWECVFWHIDIDTIPPMVTCGVPEGDTLIVPTGTHDCAAHLILPAATATDSCHNVKLVKATIEGLGTFSLTNNGTEWVSSTPIKIPMNSGTIQIIYEAFDDCHNVGYDTCYIRVKDKTRPVAVCDKGVNVSLTAKKVWVNASSFDEGSWDNCGINMLLARRSDWKEACVSICDSTTVYYAGIKDTIYQPYLNHDKHQEPIEAHYAKTIDWLANDGGPCASLIAEAWYYDLNKYVTVDCKGVLTEEKFDQLYKDQHTTTEDFDQIQQIGGGWNKDVFFSCDDACGPVTVEILVMDYWCNWSKCWTDVWVEDKTPISIEKDVATEIDITCKTYKNEQYLMDGEVIPVSLGDLVSRADAGEQAAFDKLDEILGTYRKAWRDPAGKYVDLDGNELVCEITLADSTCFCEDFPGTKLYHDDHLGWIEIDTTARACTYSAVIENLNHGVIVVNCAQNVQCEQDIWTSFDHCGQGVIYRKFKIWQGCPASSAAHTPDTIIRIQKIWVGNECPLDTGMFTMPEDATVDMCSVIFDTDGSGNVAGPAHPDSIGRPVYTFDDDCRIVGIGYYDKVFRVVGGDEACMKVIRTWCFTDWCETEKPISDSWWADPTYAGNVFKHVQKIIIRDTLTPLIAIAPLAGGDVVSAGGCAFNFATTVSVEDECGVLSYRWQLLDANSVAVGSDNGTLDMTTGDMFDVAVTNLGTGAYTLKAIVTDDCQNEGTATYAFVVTTEKKPSVICLTSITVEMNPMDLDSDGVIDTGMAVIWASEFQGTNSSAPACDDDSLAYYIEFLDGVGDDTLSEEDSDSLAIGCEHLPNPFLVRVWVKSFPSGTSDFCDVMIVPQDNMGACGTVSSSNGVVGGVILTELDESVELVEVKAILSNGSVLNATTADAGSYNFATAMGLNVEITPVKDIDHMNGISTSDLIQIQKHILGKSLFENELRLIAADVNDDQKISALDLLDLRRLILGKDDKLLNSKSWRFINSIDGRASYAITGIDRNMDVDFKGIKIGDVNVDNDPSRSAGRTAGNLVLNADDVTMTAGNKYQVAIKASEFVNIEGYQFTIQFDQNSIRLADISYDNLDLTADNFGLQKASEGLISTSWQTSELVGLESNEVLFTLTFEAIATAQLSEAMTLNSKVTDAEAYNTSNELLGVALNFGNTAIQTDGFVLYQNRPNPFKSSTAIGFELPEQMNATITIYDVTGKMIKSIEGQYGKGYNEITVEQSDLNVSGVLYYQLDSETFTATRKMIVID